MYKNIKECSLLHLDRNLKICVESPRLIQIFFQEIDECKNIKNTADLSVYNLVDNNVYEYMLIFKVFYITINVDVSEKIICACEQSIN